MFIRILNVRLLHVTLGAVLLLALLPMPNHMMPMRAMSMGAATTSLAANFSVGHSAGSCCDAIGPFLLACDFMVSQSARDVLSGGSGQVVNSTPAIQPIYIEAATPPPKA